MWWLEDSSAPRAVAALVVAQAPAAAPVALTRWLSRWDRSLAAPWGPEAAHEPEIPFVGRSRTPGPGQRGPGPANARPQGFFAAPANAAPRPGVVARPTDTDGSQTCRLLRYFDFDVEQGAKYRYRVSLVLKNPNFGVDGKYLARDDLKNSEAIESPWSEPTDVITVPWDVRLLVQEVRQERSSPEPQAQIVVTAWLKSGITAHQDFVIYRGQMLDWKKSKFQIGPTPKPPLRPTLVPVDYATNSLAIDLMGEGKSGKILVLDKNTHKLVAHNALEEQFKKPHEPSAAPKSGPPAKEPTASKSGGLEGL